MNKPILYFMLLAAATLLSISCSHNHSHDHHDGDEAAHAEHHHEGITLEPEKAKAAGIVVETAKKGEFHGIIHTSGMVMAASCDETTVVATLTGRIGHSGHLSEGMHIASGANLYTITAAGMQTADGDPVQRAKIDYEKAQRDFERAETLVKDHIITDKDFQLAKAEYEAAELTYNAVKRTRSAGGIVVKSPKAGYVKQTLVKEGDYVEAGQPLMVITQNQHLYLKAEVPERYWNRLSSIVGAKFRTSYGEHLYDVTKMGGHVQSYGRSAETQNAYIPIIFEFNNTGDVVQGSYADIYLIAGKRSDIITLPITALTEEQGVHFVYIQEDEDGYRKQEVTTGASDGERIEITSGLHAGERVVTEGAVQLKLASVSNAIPAHTHNH